MLLHYSVKNRYIYISTIFTILTIYPALGYHILLFLPYLIRSNPILSVSFFFSIYYHFNFIATATKSKYSRNTNVVNCIILKLIGSYGNEMKIEMKYCRNIIVRKYEGLATNYFSIFLFIVKIYNYDILILVLFVFRQFSFCSTKRFFNRIINHLNKNRIFFNRLFSLLLIYFFILFLFLFCPC